MPTRGATTAVLTLTLVFAALTLAPILALGADWAKDLGHKDPERRRQAAVNLGLAGDHAAEPELERALSDRDPGVRYGAIRSLGLLRSRKALARLGSLAKSKDPGERDVALEALARIGGSEALAELAAAVGFPNAAHAAAACRALQWAQDDAGSLARLRAALSRPEPSVRAAAAFALARRGAKEAGPAAVGLLKDPLPSVRIEAAQALAALGDARFLDELEAAAAKETDALARQTFEAAARRLSR